MRSLYFDSESAQKQCHMTLLQAQGFSSQLDQYEILEELGSGAAGEVRLVRHRLTL